VTPSNHGHVEELFLRCLDLSMLDCVSIELQSWATAQQAGDYARVLADRFGVAATPCANAYVREPAAFAGIDAEGLTAQMRSVAGACAARGILFHSQPRALEVANIRSYLSGRWEEMSDRRSRCAVPWVSAEITARGDVTPCHTFHDLTIGNIHEQGLLEIWRGARLKRLQSHLRDGLFPICTACCRYYGGAGAVGTPPAEGS
jgi:radical SAM protein with 4Fe4S-binding SPASM domain